MNPVLLKSGGQRPSDGAYLCSVHVLGRHWATEDYGELGQRTGSLMEMVVAAHNRLHYLTNSDVIVLEGAGSCTELNLIQRDIVNIPLIRKVSMKLASQNLPTFTHLLETNFSVCSSYNVLGFWWQTSILVEYLRRLWEQRRVYQRAIGSCVLASSSTNYAAMSSTLSRDLLFYR